MLLSTSELFWVGLIRGALSVEPLPPPNDPDHYYYRDERPPTLYDLVSGYGDICGLGRVAFERHVTREDCNVELTDVRWGRKGRVVDSTEIATAIAAMTSIASAVRAGFREEDTDGEYTKRFDELLEEQSSVACGYSPSTPAVIYALKKSGRIIEDARVTQMPQGIVRVVMRLLSPHIDMPPVAFMALAASGDPVPDWHEWWIPSSWSLESPLTEANHRAAADVIDNELIGAAREDPAYLLGWNIGRAEQLFQEIGQWICYELSVLRDKELNVRSLSFTPAKSDESETPEPDGGDAAIAPEDERDPSDGDDRHESGGEAIDLDESWDEWLEEIRVAMRAAVTQVGLGSIDLHAAHEGVLRYVSEALRGLESSKALASKLGIDTVVPAIDEGLARGAALVNEPVESPAISPGDLLSQQERNRESILNYGVDVLRRAIPLAFGELRLRELHIDGEHQGLKPDSLQGWSKLVENGRSAVRDALTLLKNGHSPYVVINVVQPVVEAVVRTLAAKNLEHVQGADLGNALHALHKHAKQRGDRDLEAVASIGLALRTPRNNAVHDSDRMYDKHDAAFFLNGLAIMLRAL